MDERRREKPSLGGISALASFLWSAVIVAALAALRHMMDNGKELGMCMRNNNMQYLGEGST